MPFGNVAYLEVKSTASHNRRWILQAKYASPEEDKIPIEHRFVCCVDLTVKPEPDVFVFPASVVSEGLTYFYKVKGFPDSLSYMLALNNKPRHKTKDPKELTVGEHIRLEKYLENYCILGIQPLKN